MENSTKIALGLGIVAVIGYLVWKNSQKNATSQGYNFDVNSLEYAAFKDDLMQKYQNEGRPNNGDVITTAYGTYTYTMTTGPTPASYYPDGYWTKSSSLLSGAGVTCNDGVRMPVNSDCSAHGGISGQQGGVQLINKEGTIIYQQLG